MKTLYIECNMGAAGDMLTAALVELLPDPDAFIHRMNHIGIPGLCVQRMEKHTNGVRGTHISVTINGEEEISDDVFPDDDHHHGDHDHHHPTDHHGHHHSTDGHAHHDHHHAGLSEVGAIVENLDLPEAVKRDVMGVYALIAEAEAFAHGTTVEKVHFHEVGMMDAIADISAVCLLMHMIAPERKVVSPLCTGYGEVRCMHGVMPVPAPATAYLLRGMPAYSGSVRGELLTPTGAALIKYFADEFGHMPEMRIVALGCGIGMKEFEKANCVRAMLGETDAQVCDEVMEICCNLDDMNGEAIAYAAESLMQLGALDVYLVPIQMKKGRPATMLACICRTEDTDRLAEAMLKHTSTLGVRMQKMQRKVLSRMQKTVDTVYGPVEVKMGEGFGVHKMKAEYESAAKVARKKNVPLADVIRAAMEKL